MNSKVQRLLGAHGEQLAPLWDRYDQDGGPWDAWPEARFQDVLSWADELSDDADSASDWIIYKNAVAELDSLLGAGTTPASGLCLRRRGE
ncbi:MAG: hypothetical protein J4N32_00155 [Chloroflexi bacterium]|nr:hypothetical protein [Chloroflexota bacterium]